MQSPHVTAWGYFWLSWMFTAIGVELYWVFVNSANTLSDQVWAAEMIDLGHPLDFAEWTPAHYAIAILLWLFFAWLSAHLPFGYIR